MRPRWSKADATGHRKIARLTLANFAAPVRMICARRARRLRPSGCAGPTARRAHAALGVCMTGPTAAEQIIDTLSQRFEHGVPRERMRTR